MKKKKEKSIFQQEMERDIGTFKRLHGKKRLQFVMDYYKWYILAAIVIILIIASFAHMFYGKIGCMIGTLNVSANTD